MKKRLLLVMLIVALVMSFSFSALAADITNPKADDPNQYKITEALQGFSGTEDLWIGTLDKWKAEGKAVGDTGTVFVNGEAIHGNDLVITNGKIGAVLSVGTRNPWGYPSGSILDVGTVSEMKGGRDTVWSVEFLVNGWDSWAPDNCGVVTFDLVKYDFDKKVEDANGLSAIKVSRIYSVGGTSFDVDTYYGIAPDANYIMMFDKITNTTGTDTKVVSNRFAMTNKGDDGGAMFNINDNTVIGCYGNTEKNQYCTAYSLPGENLSSAGVAHKWSATGGSVGYKELRANYAFKDKESVTFDEYVIVSSEPTTKDYNDFLMDYKGITEKTAVSGVVKDADGKVVSEPVVTVMKDGKAYGWYIGKEDGSYTLDLPKGVEGFTAYVERDGYAKGEAKAVDTSGDKATVDLVSGAAKAKVKFNLKDQDGKPVYGKVELFDAQGNSAYPVVRFCGDSIYQAKEAGVIEAEIAPGDYKAVVYGQGFWFYSNPVEVKANTKDGDQNVTIELKYSAPEGWLSADLHHHANKNDAFADPKDAVPSMMASGLDVAFVTDHDFTVNNAEAYELAKKYDMTGFVPSEEISCSWAHFNVIPLNQEAYDYFKDENQENHVMNQFGQLPAFIAQTHDTGAAITANHPWQYYGLFYAAAYGSIPGGYTDDYDNIELNSCCPDNENLAVIVSTTDLWTSYVNGSAIYKDAKGEPVVTRKAHYFVGGSDTHDVLYPGFAGKDYTNVRGSAYYASGKIRTYAYVGETSKDVTANGLAYAQAVVNGNSYTTYGPLLNMDKLPGEVYNVNGDFELSMEIKSLANIKDILVLTKDADSDYEALGTSMYTEQYLQYDKKASRLNVNAKEIDFSAKVPVAAGENTWVAFMVIDINGNYAITNPFWIVDESPVSSFKDVDPNAWYAPYVQAMVADGVINGYADGTFKPDSNVTRAEFAKMFYQYAPKADKAKDTTFKDVKKGQWYYEAVTYMAQNGYINGYPDGTFKPNNKITRAEIATIITNIYGDLKATTDITFSDVKQGQWFYDAVMNLAEAGYVGGMGNGIFAPNDNATRAQAAKFIYVAVNNGKILLNEVQ
ncbi:MAG: S-layer homology domain-containing protein [Bacillota bacterium]|nr:S-layer homology domain-containing protein [Bacillota bacterium]